MMPGRFYDYWERHGGLPVFGYPTTDAHTEHGLGRTPHIGDTVEFDGALLTVTELDGLRISGVRLERTFAGRIDDRVEFDDRD